MFGEGLFLGDIAESCSENSKDKAIVKYFSVLPKPDKRKRWGHYFTAPVGRHPTCHWQQEVNLSQSIR
jgi:hypothetical protein